MRSRSSHTRTVADAAVLVLLALTLVGCSEPAPEETVFQGAAMGTSFTVKVVTPAGFSEQRRFEVGQAIDRTIAEINAKMSTYEPDSELSRFNRSKSTEPFEFSPETIEALVAARQVGRRSDGAFDVTVGPLVNAWGFGPEERRELDQAEIDRLLELTGWDRINIDPTALTATKTASEVALDLSAIAKGYAVDRVSEMLAAEWDLRNHLTEIGGEVRASGSNAADRPWRVGVEKPGTGAPGIQRVLALEDLSLATSGDYRNYYEVDGKRLSHVIDPRTGRPIEHRTASVAVVSETCMAADAWATALMVLGEKDGMAKAAELGLAALFLVREGDGFVERMSPAFEQRFADRDR